MITGPDPAHMSPQPSLNKKNTLSVWEAGGREPASSSDGSKWSVQLDAVQDEPARERKGEKRRESERGAIEESIWREGRGAKHPYYCKVRSCVSRRGFSVLLKGHGNPGAERFLVECDVPARFQKKEEEKMQSHICLGDPERETTASGPRASQSLAETEASASR
ncbi:hypothetical protein EYF80_065248 [Liparis tanakae]|uniref:Uncharacterized protein n=1 Tax=Liparis tanakae TaxID=230148 RepID=A0A4Z2E776_9TELE|nr:hypothetical protein EYF80_065248 [Liparis tanakae]